MSDISGDDLGLGPLSAAEIGLLVRQHEASIRGLRHWRGNAEMKINATELGAKTMHEDLLGLREQVKGIQRLLIWLLTTITGSSLGLAFAVLAATGKI